MATNLPYFGRSDFTHVMRSDIDASSLHDE